eukprot:5919430-Amphidinium_carterae.2
MASPVATQYSTMPSCAQRFAILYSPNTNHYVLSSKSTDNLIVNSILKPKIDIPILCSERLHQDYLHRHAVREGT